MDIKDLPGAGSNFQVSGSSGFKRKFGSFARKQRLNKDLVEAINKKVKSRHGDISTGGLSSSQVRGDLKELKKELKMTDREKKVAEKLFHNLSSSNKKASLAKNVPQAEKKTKGSMFGFGMFGKIMKRKERGKRSSLPTKADNVADSIIGSRQSGGLFAKKLESAGKPSGFAKSSSPKGTKLGPGISSRVNDPLKR